MSNKAEIPRAWDGEPIDHFEAPDVTEEKADGIFHIGQSYEDKPADTIYCTRCGGGLFHVGAGNYFTGIKCATCLWERCIHDG